MATRTAAKNSKKIEWIPQAIIRKPVTYFQKHLGLKFSEDFDNLDYFLGTSPMPIGDQFYVLRHYRGFPADSMGVYLPNDLIEAREITKTIELIAEKLHLPSTAISWHRGMST